MTTPFTPGPWTARTGRANSAVYCGAYAVAIGITHPEDAQVIAAAPMRLAEAKVLRCLVTSRRFQGMTVAEALAELADNGCGHDDGEAIRYAETVSALNLLYGRGGCKG